MSFSWTINPVGGGCSSPGQKLGNPGFESGSAPWTASAGVIGAFTGQSPHDEGPGTVFDRLTVQLGTTTLATFSNVDAAAGYQLTAS